MYTYIKHKANGKLITEQIKRKSKHDITFKTLHTENTFYIKQKIFKHLTTLKFLKTSRINSTRSINTEDGNTT